MPEAFDLTVVDHNDGSRNRIEGAAEVHISCRQPVTLRPLSNADTFDRSTVAKPLAYILKPLEHQDWHVVAELGGCEQLTGVHRLSGREPSEHVEPKRLSRAHEVGSDVTARISELTPREAEVMDLIVEGKTQKQIAALLEISIQTASKHRAKILEKLRVANDVELLRFTLALDRPGA